MYYINSVQHIYYIHQAEQSRYTSHDGQNFPECLENFLKSILSYSNVQGKISSKKKKKLQISWNQEIFWQLASLTESLAYLKLNHRFSQEIQEHWAPFSSQNGAPIRCFRVFPKIKITMIRQVHMSPTSTAVGAWRWIHVKSSKACNTSTLICAKIMGAFCFWCVVGKDWSSPIGAPWLTMPLQGGIGGLVSPV